MTVKVCDWLVDCIESMFTEFLPGLQVMTSSPVQKTWILQSTHPQPRQSIYIFQSPHFRVKFNLRTNPKGPQFSSLRSKSGFDWIRFGHMRCTTALASPFSQIDAYHPGEQRKQLFKISTSLDDHAFTFCDVLFSRCEEEEFIETFSGTSRRKWESSLFRFSSIKIYASCGG